MSITFDKDGFTDFTLFDRDHKMFLNPWFVDGCKDDENFVRDDGKEYITCWIDIKPKDNDNPKEQQADFGILFDENWGGNWWFTFALLESPVQPYWPPEGYD